MPVLSLSSPFAVLLSLSSFAVLLSLSSFAVLFRCPLSLSPVLAEKITIDYASLDGNAGFFGAAECARRALSGGLLSNTRDVVLRCPSHRRAEASGRFHLRG